MSRVTPFQTGFEVDDATLSPGAIFRKKDGSLWEVLPNGDQQALGGGGSQPTTRAQYGGNAVTIADGNSASVTWDTKFLGDALLVLTDPANPAIVTAGVYAVAVTVTASAMTAGGDFVVILNLDNDNDDPTAAGASTDANGCAVTLVYYIPAGGTIVVQVRNHDGAASRDFTLSSAVVQRLS